MSTEPSPPGSLRCPRCGVEAGPDQDWCLECGAPARTRLAATPNWRLPTVVLLAVVVVAGASLAFAFASLTDDDGGVVPPGTAPIAVEPEVAPAPAVPPAQPSPTPPPTAAPPTATPAPTPAQPPGTTAPAPAPGTPAPGAPAPTVPAPRQGGAPAPP